MIGTHGHRDLAGGGARRELSPERCPADPEIPVIVQSDAGLVPLRRQMMGEDGTASGTPPAVEIPFDPARPPQPAPHHGPANPEPHTEVGQAGRMAERVGAVQHRRFGTELPRHRDPDLQVPGERYAGGNQLIGQDIPRPDRELASPHQCLDRSAGPGHHREIVLDQDHLAVEVEAKPRGRLEQFEQPVHRRNQPGREDAPGQVPLPIPVDMRDQVKSEPSHSARIFMPDRASGGTALGRPSTWRTKSSHQSRWASVL